MRTFCVALLFFILASLSPAYAQAAGEIAIRNESQNFSLITVTFIAKGEHTEIDVMIDPGESKPVPISGDGPVDVDCDMGMNDVHFLFTGVALGGADTLVVRDTEKPGQEEIRPTLVILAGGKETKSIAGTMTQDDLSGYTDEEKAELKKIEAAFTAEKTAEDVIAVLYTRAKYQGIAWEITKAGKYDLEEDFRLPNDSILSLHILPGYEITLYEHAGFKGASKTWRDNDPELQGEWRRQASSFVIERQNGAKGPVDRDVIRNWLAEVAAARNNEPDTSALYADTENITAVLAKHAASFEFFTLWGKTYWYGVTDAQRVDMAGNLLQLFSELGHDIAEWTPNTFAQQINNYMDKAGGYTTVDLAVAYSTLPDGGVKFSVRTSVRETKASELAAWLAEGIGSGGGHREKAGGYIAGSKYQERYGDKPISVHCEESIREYCRAFRIVDCANPAGPHGWTNMQEMKTYRKLPVRVGFVPCSELFDGRCELQLRMLEGDMDVKADENSILMIGVMGEVYLMERGTFTRNYRIEDEPYAPELPYAPTALNKNTGKRISLLEHARACTGLSTDAVKAVRLNERVKVFTRWDKENYFSGTLGDWLVGRSPEDLYIVTAEVFEKIYARDLTGEEVAFFPDARLVIKQDIPVKVIFSEKAGVLETLEGKVAYENGDALLTGVDGESWTVSRHSFEERYEPDGDIIMGENGIYRPVPKSVWAAQGHEAFTIVLPGEKGSLIGKPGDWLVHYGPGEYGIVDVEIFKTRYRAV